MNFTLGGLLPPKLTEWYFEHILYYEIIWFLMVIAVVVPYIVFWFKDRHKGKK